MAPEPTTTTEQTAGPEIRFLISNSCTLPDFAAAASAAFLSPVSAAFLRPTEADLDLACEGLEDRRDRELLCAIFNRLSLAEFHRVVAELEHIEQCEKRHSARVERILHPDLPFVGDDDDEPDEDECRLRRENLRREFGLAGERGHPGLFLPAKDKDIRFMPGDEEDEPLPFSRSLASPALSPGDDAD